MINITYHRKYNRVTIDGHADYAPKGEDIVCAGVSALAMTLGENVRWMEEKGYLQSSKVDISDGNGIVECRPSPRYSQSVAQVFTTICVGFEIMAQIAKGFVHYEVLG